MVVLIDLEDEPDDEHPTWPSVEGPNRDVSLAYRTKTTAESHGADSRPNPNRNLFSAALSCYPVVTALASLLDLNTLADLSLTCRQFHVNLSQFRRQLIAHALRCVNENASPSTQLANAIRTSHAIWNRFSLDDSRILSGRVGQCARDLVGPCRKCGVVVCRNCVTKPPPRPMLAGRHRRLCRTCLKAPLWKHTAPCTWQSPDESLDASPVEEVVYDPSVFTYNAYAREPCNCAEMVWICNPCGSGLRKLDDTYVRGWTWRGKYSHLGGVGIGEGNEGVECGRGDRCLAPYEVEHEIDCNPQELADMAREIHNVEAEGRTWTGASYLTQEVEGIGGVVKTKIRKRVRLGAVVREYQDEREHGDYLRREREAIVRSWCAWCSRVVPSKKDTEHMANTSGTPLARTISGASSSSSSSDEY